MEIDSEDGTLAVIATEHGMDSAVNATEHGMDLGTLLNNSRNRSKLEIQVEFNNGMWWTMPPETSDDILAEWHAGSQQVSFVWDWDDVRPGSYRPDGATTSYSRYIIDFDTMCQRNTDNDRTRKVKVVYVVR